MSTTTTNYGLVKPELTDVADITAMNPNWDIIDEKLLSLTNSSTKIEKWEKGVNIKDLGTGYFYLDEKLEEGDAEAMGLPEKYGSEWVGLYVVIKGMEDYDYEAYLHDWYDDSLWYTMFGSNITWNQIITDATENIGKVIGAVSLDGSEPMTGDLSIKKSYPRLELENTDNGRILAFLASDSYIQIANYLGDTNYRGIRIKPETEDVASSLVLHEIVSGEVNNYNIFGEHNRSSMYTVSQTDITAGTTQLEDGKLYIVYE